MKCVLILLLCAVVCTIAYKIPPLKETTKDWWETASFYQIYPRSYKDSDGDGIGDLRGIIENLEHIKDAGLQATWLSPIFKSPMVDFGYDISDFFSIQPEYGTMEDFVELMNKAKDLDIKIILDFVPNHSSDQNEWFLKSVERDPEYENFYVWHPGRINPENPDGPRLPPNNWLSVFRGSAWTWNDIRGEFYLHQFASAQPDLNYNNPAVRQKMLDVLHFWLDKGASGFRVDAVPHLTEDPEFRDEEISGLTDDPLSHSYLIHDKTQNLPLTYEIVREWRKFLDEYTQQNGGYTRLMMVEAYASVEHTMAYFGNITHPGGHFPFNFLLISSTDINSNARDFKESIDSWLDNLPDGKQSNWVLGNHDQRRISTRLGVPRADSFSILLRLLPGVGITYQGEEIVMEDVWISWEDTVDPQACNTNPEVFENYSRDVARTPFQWDNTTSAGFSTSENTWLPVSPYYQENNLAKQQQEEKSHYKLFQKLSQARLTDTIKDGDVTVEALTDNVLAFTRELENNPTFVIVLNLGGEIETINLLETFAALPNELTTYLASVNSNRDEGDIIDSSEVKMISYEALVLIA